LPARGATTASVKTTAKPTNFYPRSPRGERPSFRTGKGRFLHFYPRSPRGERRSASALACTALQFLSTLPARGATGGSVPRRWSPGYFYPRSPRGERPVVPADRRVVALISIHAPREGSDGFGHAAAHRTDGFLSTLPARGATKAHPAQRSPGRFLSTLPA